MEWQAIVASITVLAAAAWLSGRCWRVFRRAMSGGPIGDCGHCPRARESEMTTPLVQLGEEAPSGKADALDASRQHRACHNGVKRAAADEG